MRWRHSAFRGGGGGSGRGHSVGANRLLESGAGDKKVAEEEEKERIYICWTSLVAKGKKKTKKTKKNPEEETGVYK